MDDRWSEGKECLDLEMSRTESNDAAQNTSDTSTVSPQLHEPYQPESKFMDLPLDLILQIFYRLQTCHDSTALSIACRGLFTNLFTEARDRFDSNDDAFDELETILMVERYAPPGVIYCHFCSTIHTADKEYRRASCVERKYLKGSLDRQLPGGETRKLMFIDAYVVANALSFNKPGAHKLLESLRWKSATRVGRSQWTHQAEARVADSARELLLETTSRHVHPDQPFEEFTYSVCKHVHIYARYPFIFAELDKLHRKDRPDNWSHVGSSCAVCRAQWDIETEWSMEPGKVAHQGWGLKIWSRHFLGDLRNPSCKKWKLCSGAYTTPNVGEIFEQNPSRWNIVYRTPLGVRRQIEQELVSLQGVK